jgi:NAD-reducing hydrogenase large subunit
MNRTVAQIARSYITPGCAEIPEPLLNRVEHGIRCFDPCLSCSTHAYGKMPLHVRLLGPGGELLHEAMRD